MKDIYTCSYFTIAAAAAKSLWDDFLTRESGLHGMPTARISLNVGSLNQSIASFSLLWRPQGDIEAGHTVFLDDVTRSQWNRRTWTFQVSNSHSLAHNRSFYVPTLQ